ncbi:hypothetical protein [Lacipirellula limnantheis]|uniref:Uncharacterized protein n=1 Tax=Lacipirellula limnantheis TaxID=2528024 RepID=A0A517TW34_9BACT|nr:hypothetical protein [Lacipirellula limnantheis]QDT72585.1 hypothetical protein I41_17650 [Lacipirellula limnantheis]
MLHRVSLALRLRPLATVALLAAGAISSFSYSHAAEPFWRQVMPRKRVAADPNGDYSLAEKNGPWLIMAMSFNGEGGETEARELVTELRTKYNLPAYYYAMTFKLEDERPGRGIDNYGTPIKRRYQRGSQILEHAVLVGEFQHIDDAEAQALLDRVKTLEPECLKVESGEATSQSLVAVRQLQRSVKQKLGKQVNRGPMGHAFLTRNPMLPKEYFAPVGVDAEVAKWNKDFEHSLLKCPGKYTIKVATFSGKTSLKEANNGSASGGSVRRAQENDALVVAVDKAHKLTVALRSKGWEAYEFHDRYESYVTVGSFNDLQRNEYGQLTASTREAQIIVNTFGAATPNVGFERATYQAIGADSEDIQKAEHTEEKVLSEFDQRFSKSFGDVMEGFHPKDFVGLPFDIQPTAIEAPKESVSSAYVRQ